MVTTKQLEKSAIFLKALHGAKNPNRIKDILRSAATSCLNVLLLLIKDCINLRIPLQLEPSEKRRIDKYRQFIRGLTGKREKRTR